jgi:hypothetical protein
MVVVPLISFAITTKGLSFGLSSSSMKMIPPVAVTGGFLAKGCEDFAERKRFGDIQPRLCLHAAGLGENSHLLFTQANSPILPDCAQRALNEVQGKGERIKL